MSSMPFALLAIVAAALLLSRPYLAARRPPMFLPLLMGVALGPSASGAIPRALLEDLEPLLALAAGWLAVRAAESFDMSTLLRLRVGRRIVGIGLAAAMVAGLGALWPALAMRLRDLPGLMGLAAPAVMLACVVAAIDPAGARTLLDRAWRPDGIDRMAPAVAGLALGGALLASNVAAGLEASIVREGRPITWFAAGHAALGLVIGLALGTLFVFLLRRVDGRAFLLAWLVCLPLIGWGIARSTGMSPLAVLFSAGVMLANDARRRDLIFDLLREIERPFTMVVLFVSGAAIPLSWRGALFFWLMAASVALARPLAWRVAPATGLRVEHALLMSPLAIVLSLELTRWRGNPPFALDLFPAAIAVAAIVNEGIWILIARRSRHAAGATS